MPAHIDAVPTMISDEEKLMLAYLGAKCTGQGSIVELGALFGGSAACIASGAASSGKNFRMDVYDFFAPYRPHVERYLIERGHPDPGSDTLPLVRSFLAEFGDNVRLHKSDILKVNWTGGEIELLHVDAAKSNVLCHHICREFMPHLIPGKSVVVVQDYLMQGHPWALHMMYALRDHFEFAGTTRLNSALFSYTGGIVRDSSELADILNANDGDYLEAICRMKRYLHEDEHFDRMAAHIALIIDNPGARHVADFPKRDLNPKRLIKIREAYDLN